MGFTGTELKALRWLLRYCLACAARHGGVWLVPLGLSMCSPHGYGVVRLYLYSFVFLWVGVVLAALSRPTIIVHDAKIRARWGAGFLVDNTKRPTYRRIHCGL